MLHKLITDPFLILVNNQKQPFYASNSFPNQIIYSENLYKALKKLTFFPFRTVCHRYVTSMWFVCDSHVHVCHLYVTRMSSACHLYVLVCHWYVTCMYSYAIRLSLVCTCMSSVCHSYVLVCHPYVTLMYCYVIRMWLICTRMSSECHSYVPVCHSYVTRIYSYVTRMWFYHEPFLNCVIESFYCIFYCYTKASGCE